MKVAILHEMLIKLGGAEKVVETFLEIFPDASLFTLIYDEKKVGTVFPKHKINSQVFKLKTQKIYNIFKKQRLCLSYMSQSIENLDFSSYDLVLCSSSGFAHGAITKPETKFVVYYHSPSRYLWDYTFEYQKNLGFNKIFGYFLRKLLNKLRIWDYIASQRVDFPIIASKHISKRLEKYYKRFDYKILYPPVEVDKFIPLKKIKKENYYITIAALTEWKKLDILINNFNKLEDKKLKIIGVGNYEKEYKKMVKHKNIEFLGYKTGMELVELLQKAYGFVFVSEEDFGISIVESMAASTPVFALGKGGALETIIKGETGDFFYDINGKDFIKNFKKFEKNIELGIYKKETLIKQAKKFSKQTFIREIKNLINRI